jgi:hypothetical protein
MATISVAQAWHEGETDVHRRTHGLNFPNPTAPFLTPQLAFGLQHFPLLALGALDDQDRPWTSIWGGEEGLAAPISNSVVGVRTPVETTYDPVVKALLGGKTRGKGSVVQAGEDGGKMIGGLTIDLMKRKRVKLCGRLLAGALDVNDEEGDEPEKNTATSEVQMAVKIEQSLGKSIYQPPQRPVTPSLDANIILQEIAPST